MKTTVRPMRASDTPSEYSGSDVLEADGATLKQLMEASTGSLVTFCAFAASHSNHTHASLHTHATRDTREARLALSRVLACICLCRRAVVRPLPYDGARGEEGGSCAQIKGCACRRCEH